MTPRRYSVEWMEVARYDLESIVAHLLVEAPQRAEKIVDRIIDKGESLLRLPQRGRVVPELREVGERRWLEVQEPPWRIIYRVAGKVVEIHAVLDSRRDLADVLRERIVFSG